MVCGINSKQGQEDNFKIDNFFSKGKKKRGDKNVCIPSGIW